MLANIDGEMQMLEKGHKEMVRLRKDVGKLRTDLETGRVEVNGIQTAS